ncbi:hypothetical protein GCM10023063_19520 [Arthrobacter methylotrophus]
MQGDGNLVLYGPSGALWSTSTHGAGNWAVMQGDGNLVVYTSGGRAVWNSGTDRMGPSSLQVQNDGNLVIYKDGYPTWSRDSGPLFHKLGNGSRLNAGGSRISLDRRYTLIMQGDGNLVLYGPSGAAWSSATSGSGNWAVMQGDGNLVVYTSGGKALWASGTGGQSGAELYVQGDGNLVLYRNRRAIWDRHSGGGNIGGGGSGGATGGAATVIQAATAKMHAPYVWGAKGPNSFDCSGLVQFAFAAAGRSVPAPASSQYNNCPNKIPYTQAQPGDLVFFGAGITHVGIYTGNGMMISALPQGGVQTSPVREFRDVRLPNVARYF